MTKRQQKREIKKIHTMNRKVNDMNEKSLNNSINTLRETNLKSILGFMKGILVVKQEKELMWSLINKYPEDVFNAFRPRA